MPGLNQPPHDVEVADVPNHPDQVDLFPLSAKGVEVVSGYLGCDASVNTPVRMARERYPGFNEFIFNYVKDRGTSFSTGAKPRYRGQRRADQFETDLINDDPAIPRELAGHLSCDNKFLVLKDHDFSVLHMRYGAPANGQLYKMTRPSFTYHRVYESLHSEESLRATMNPITVVHGPVRYMPAAERNEHLRTLSRQNATRTTRAPVYEERRIRVGARVPLRDLWLGSAVEGPCASAGEP